MTEGKRQIIQQLLQEYDIETAEDIQEALKDLLGGTIKEMMEAEMDDHLGYEKSERSDSDDYRIDAIHYSVRDNGIIRKMAAYVILGVSCEGKKDVLTIEVGDNESAKYWLAVLNSLKNRGVKDILIICADGLTGIREAIQAAFPKTEYQRCIVHQVRNTLKYVADKDRKAFANDLKTIYNAPNEEQGRANRDRITEKWSEKNPNAMKRWERDWDVITPIFKFSANVRTVIYTTNAIESLNATYRKLNRQRSVFPSDQALLKALYLATFEATKKWSMPIRN
jgi:transposase-like protein